MTDRIPFLSPKFPTVEEVAADYATIVERRVYSNGGPFEREFIAALEDWVGNGAAFSVVSSGTAGLHLAIESTFRTGRKYGVVASFTFAAGPLALRSCGYEPAFLDIDSDSWQPHLALCQEFLEGHAGETAGILLTNTFGVANPEMEDWERLADLYELPLVVDSAAGFGSHYPSGEPLGSRGTCEIFSLHATKTLAVGEGGAVSARDPDLIARIDRLKNFGFDEHYDAVLLGTNAKLPELSSAIGIRQLATLGARLRSRRDILGHYQREFAGMPVEFQPLGSSSALPFVSVAVPSAGVRAATRAALDRAGIESRTYYSPPVHLQSVFRGSRLASANMDRTLDLGSRIISLPINDDLTAMDVVRIAAACKEVLKANGV